MKRIGIDVGGTGIQIGVVDENHRILAEDSIPTQTAIPFADQVRAMADCILKVTEKAGLKIEEIESIGAGIPGIALEDGTVDKCTNMGWDHVPFRAEFSKYFNQPVYIDNDANVAALAESVAGISAGTSSSVFITIGTGIGSGIIINGKIWKGFHGIGAELGHVIMCLDGEPCTCGNRGCLERYCSATAIIRMGREAARKNPGSMLNRFCGGDPEKINAKMVIDAARQGDPAGQEVYGAFINYLSQAVASVVNLLDPEIIVLGGGVSKAGNFLLDPILDRYRQYIIFKDLPIPDVKLAILGSEAGIIGAAMLS